MSRLISFLRGNLIAVIALSIALGGFAYANQRNSVGAKEWKVPVVRDAGGFIQPGESKGFVRNCRNGERYISGGYDASPADADPQPLNVSTAGPNINLNGRANGFSFIATNNGTVQAPVEIYALCLPK